jgi:hypothetical protein
MSQHHGAIIELLNDDHDTIDDTIDMVKVYEDRQYKIMGSDDKEAEVEEENDQPRQSGKIELQASSMNPMNYVLLGGRGIFSSHNRWRQNKTPADARDDADNALEVVAHYITMHYDEQEKLRKGKKKYRPKSGQYGLNAEPAVTKELHQFNSYDVFETLSLLIFLKEIKESEK